METMPVVTYMFLVDSVIVGAVGTVEKSTMEGGAGIRRSDMERKRYGWDCCCW